MGTVTPSIVVDAIDQMFGPGRSELDMNRVQANRRDEVRALLALIDQIPRPLIRLAGSDYVTFNRCYASLSGALSVWSVAVTGPPARQVEGLDPLATIRRLLSTCPDELPPPIELEFVEDSEVRSWLTSRGAAAWTDFAAGDWLGASVMAGAALEGLLLWGVKCAYHGDPPKTLDRLGLKELVDRAVTAGLLDSEEEASARQAADVRNLVHLGKVGRRQKPIGRGQALSALAAFDLAVAALARRFAAPVQQP